MMLFFLSLSHSLESTYNYIHRYKGTYESYYTVQKIPRILKERSKVERFESQAVVRSQKLGDNPENIDLTFCLGLED